MLHGFHIKASSTFIESSQNYLQTFQSFPPGSIAGYDGGIIFRRWSVHTQLLAFLDRDTALADLNFDHRPEFVGNTTVTARPVQVFQCPSDPKAGKGRLDDFVSATGSNIDRGMVYGTNYGFVMGDWYVWGGIGSHANVLQTRPRSVFYPNSCTKPFDVVDGLSKTMIASEVKQFQSLIRDCQSGRYGLSFITSEFQIPGPETDPATLANYKSGCDLQVEGAHTQWFDGSVHHTGVTTAWTPNKRIRRNYQGRSYDVDLTGRREQRGDRGPTFAAVIPRSYHSGGVHVLIADAGVRFVSDSVAGSVWRAAGTIAGEETEPLFD